MALSLDVQVHVYLAGLGLAVGSAVVFGLIPARQAWLGHPLPALQEVRTARRVALRDVLLVAQVAICALLVTASLVAVRGLARATDQLGFRPDGVLLAPVRVGADGDQALQRAVIEEARRLPGVTAVGAVRHTPMGGGPRSVPVHRPGTAELTPANAALTTRVYPMSPDYLRAAGTVLLAGRDVSWHDGRNAPAVALVNETFALAMWGERRPIGRRFVLWERPTEVVGVVEDGRHHNLMETPQAAVFVPLAQTAASDVVLVVRSAGALQETAAALRPVLARVQPGAAFTVRPWPEALARVLFPARAATAALGLMGLFAAVLAVTGIFGMASHDVSRRRRELGIRLALGAREVSVLSTAVGRPAALLAVGSALGVLGGVLARHLLGRIVYEADPGHPAVLVGTVLTMAVVGLCGSFVPALGALAVDPSGLLREE